MSRRRCDHGDVDPVKALLRRINTDMLAVTGSYIGKRGMTVKTPFMPDKIIIRTGGGGWSRKEG